MDPPTANWDHCLEHAALSDTGLRRPNNQDAMAVVLAGSEEVFRRRGHLFTVADGMGAHAAGELASKLATDTLAHAYGKLLELSPPDALLAAIQEANLRIHHQGQDDPDFRGMGTTSTSLLLLPERALVAHVGDSRAYRLREDRLEQLTFDHSLLWEMRAVSQLPEEEIPTRIPKNIITRSLGPNSTVQPDLEGPFSIETGDTFLLCSDGLSGPVADEEIGAVLGSMPPSEAVQALVNLANLRGGPDNITVIVVRVTGPQAAQAPRAKPAAPLDGAPTAARPIHPLLWTFLGLATLAAAGAAAIRQWTAAGICLIGAVAAASVAIATRYATAEASSGLDGRPLGRGPHRTCRAAADDAFVQALDEIAGELRDAARREHWKVDWAQFNAFVSQAHSARDETDYSQAVRDYFRAISFMMAELKDQHPADDQGQPNP